MSFNISNVTNITGLGELFTVAHNVSYGVFGGVMSIVFMVLLFVGMYKSTGDARKSMIAASLASFFIDLLMLSVEMLDTYYVVIPLVVFALSLFGGD